MEVKNLNICDGCFGLVDPDDLYRVAEFDDKDRKNYYYVDCPHCKNVSAQLCDVNEDCPCCSKKLTTENCTPIGLIEPYKQGYLMSLLNLSETDLVCDGCIDEVERAIYYETGV